MKLREIYLLLEKRKKEEDEDDKARIKARKEGFGVYLDPIEEILEAAEPIFTSINAGILQAEAQKLAEINKQNAILDRHVEFVNEMAKLIASAPDNSELARIQQLIGAEKSRKGFYGDYHPKIEATCDSLLGLVSERKKIIKQNTKLQKEYETWLAAGDIVKATQLKEQMDGNDRVITQNVTAIAEAAYSQVAAVTRIDTDLPSAAISPRLHRWAWKVDDIEQLYKKRPELVEKTANVKAVNAFMKEQVEKGELDDREENLFSGLTIYRKPFFVAIKTSKDAS